MESAIETFDKSPACLVSTLIEISELYHCRIRLVSPRFRLHALSALLPAARKFGMRTTVMEQEATACLEKIMARCRIPAETKAAVSRLLARCFDDGRAELAQQLARALFLPRFRAETFVARSLLEAGWVDEARAFAAGLADPHLRYRLQRLAASETGRDVRSPGRPSDLAGRARQVALADAAVAGYRAAGLAEAVKVHRAIRYRSQRERAWYLVLGAALDDGRPRDAWRVLGRMRPGAYRERACLRLAADLVRRGRPRRARRLLAGSFGVLMQAERALSLAELRLEEGDAGGAAHVLSVLKERLVRPYEDLSRLDPSVPALPGRCAVVTLRIHQACDQEHEWEPRAFARRVLDPFDPSAVKLLVAAAAEGRLDLGRAVEALGFYAYDPVHSQWISERARRLLEGAAPSPRPVPRGIAEAFRRGLRSPSEDGSSAWRRHGVNDPERCAYDEGLSLSQHAGRHKRVLVRAVKASLKSWLRDPPPGAPSRDSRYVLAPRLRTLLNLGGTLPGEHLRRALHDAEAPTPAYLAAMSILIALDPEGAAQLYFRRHLALLLAHPRANLEVVGALEMQRVLEPGFTTGWMRLLRRLESSLGRQRAGRWLDQLTSVWLHDAGAVPRLGTLECLLRDTATEIPPTGLEAVARARGKVRRLFALSPMQMVEALIRDPTALARVAWVLPRAIPAEYGTWSPKAWEKALRLIRDSLGKVDASRVYSWARHLAPRRAARFMARCWIWGSSPLPKRLQTWELPAAAAPSPGDPWRLRYLDKRRDFFTYLRFADCVNCCFHSRSSWYWRMQKWALAVWKDPLSFCFHVENRPRGEGDWRPRGFVFGSFGVVYPSRAAWGPEPAVLLNGIYLREQRGGLRKAILEAIEQTFCRPLDVRWVGIANFYGGRGEMPDSYAERSLDFVRWRALKWFRNPVTEIYDDLTTCVNRMTSGEHLYWRRLAESRVSGVYNGLGRAERR